MSIDAAGDGLSSSIYVGRDGELVRIAQSTYLDSLGDFYASVTELLGFKPMRHEGKVMSLAAYGRPAYDLSSIIGLNGLSFDNHLGLIGGVEATRRLAELFNYPLSRARETALRMKRGGTSGGELQKRAIEIAASAQAHLEKLVGELGLRLRDRGGLPVAYAGGGVAQNVKANAVLRRILGDDNLWVFPAMDDGGLAFGAAVFVKAQFERLDGRWGGPSRLRHVYLGPAYEKGEVEEFLRKEGAEFEEVDDVPGFVADALSEGRLVGFVAGGWSSDRGPWVTARSWRTQWKRGLRRGSTSPQEGRLPALRAFPALGKSS